MAGCIQRPAPSALFACSSSQPHKTYTPLLHSPLIAFEQKKWSCGGGASQKSSCTSTPLLVANIARSSSSSGLETHTNSVTTAAAAAADESNQDNRPTISNVVKVRHADLLNMPFGRTITAQNEGASDNVAIFRLDFILNSSYGKYCRRNVAFLTVTSKLGFTHEALMLKRLSVINQALEGGGCSLSLRTETDTCGIRDGDRGFQINNNQEDQQNDFAKDYALTIWLAEFLEDTLSNGTCESYAEL
ncbi:hypothetical protein O6H91_13G044800 [Diphasiastrum complanatum]|uniref:Uncharacterized protein n=1 Tax=Diphasiastrum complanatum TaxID=34168 RepID=A0ACC2BUD8_DIPCM|nr:hypothetical protein O6H91_13G044800 [Diphasiastrum complanatum]